MVPMAMLARYGYGPATLAMPSGHAFEMLFGFILALIAGYLLGPMPRWRVVLLMLFWLLARIAGLFTETSGLALIGNSIFIFLLAQNLLPKLWVAKKWRNRMLVPLLGLICAMAIVTAVADRFDWYVLQHYLLRESVQLFALLMLFMGGRMLAPAVAGEFYRQGKELEARVQPNIEAALIVAIAGAFLCAPISLSVSGVLLILSGLLAGIRLFRWQLWHCMERLDLICLGVGYGWLAFGLILLGWVKLNDGDYFVTAIHAVTVGALGTLAANVMIRVSLLHVKQYPSHMRQIVTITILMAVSAALRIVADISTYRELWLIIATMAWSVGFLMALVIVLECLSKKRNIASGGKQNPPVVD
ncbi:hypothetical protein W03_06540 [Nitrosomonas sp. PY1]|nr:hypothetical protein W03_06540 [Nitrosomonas sp. PY1]